MGLYGKNWQELVSKNLKENVYISFDLHAFDPSLMPSVANPEPGGLFWDETMNLLKIIGMDKNIIGFDIVEFSPPKNFVPSNYYAAKLVYKILNYAFIKR
jgi:agmatinase